MDKETRNILTHIAVLVIIAAFAVGAAWLGRECLAHINSNEIFKSIGWAFLTTVLFAYSANAVWFFKMIGGDFLKLMRGRAVW